MCAKPASACAGLDKATAKRVLQAWEASGASSPDELRKLLVKRSVQSAGAVLIQTLLDAGAQHSSKCNARVTQLSAKLHLGFVRMQRR